MPCPVCQRPDPKLYRLPAEAWGGPVPPRAACFFCYLRVVGSRPRPRDRATHSAEPTADSPGR